MIERTGIKQTARKDLEGLEIAWKDLKGPEITWSDLRWLNASVLKRHIPLKITELELITKIDIQTHQTFGFLTHCLSKMFAVVVFNAK